MSGPSGAGGPATTIVLVEPDGTLRPTLAAALLRRSCDRVIEAETVEAALHACRAHAVDLVAASARLAGVGAAGLCAELRGGGPPIVAFRMGADAESHIRWLDAGGADSLSGDDPALLAARCRSVLRGIRARSAGLR